MSDPEYVTRPALLAALADIGITDLNHTASVRILPAEVIIVRYVPGPAGGILLDVLKEDAATTTTRIEIRSAAPGTDPVLTVEPQGIGAKVRDRDGDIWFRTLFAGAEMPWALAVRDGRVTTPQQQRDSANSWSYVFNHYSPLTLATE